MSRYIRAIFSGFPLLLNLGSGEGLALRVKKLGEGGQGEVYLCKSLRTGRKFAVKQIEKKEGAEDLPQEARVHSSLNHKNIVKLRQCISSKEHYYLVEEFCPSKTLYDLLYIERKCVLSEDEVRHFVLQILEALEYLHSRNIVHRDIKPENILLDGTTVKLADFGLAAIVPENELLPGAVGTIFYKAPEIVRGRGHTFPIDIWSLGVTLHELLLGYRPFDAETDSQIDSNIVNNNYVIPSNCMLSEEAIDLITWMLHPKPALRPTCKDCMEHKFFQKATTPISPGAGGLDVPTSTIELPEQAEELPEHNEDLYVYHPLDNSTSFEEVKLDSANEKIRKGHFRRFLDLLRRLKIKQSL